MQQVGIRLKGGWNCVIGGKGDNRIKQVRMGLVETIYCRLEGRQN